MSPSFNANKQFQQQQKQQQDLLRQQQMQAQYLANKKRKEEEEQKRQIQKAVDYARRQGNQDVQAGNAQHTATARGIQGGVSIHDVGDVSVGGDIIGRDKQEIIDVKVPVEQKSGCVYAIERTVTFVIGWVVSSIVLGIILGVIGSIVFMTTGSEDSAGAGFTIGAVLGVIVGLGLAIAGAGNVKRNK